MINAREEKKIEKMKEARASSLPGKGRGNTTQTHVKERRELVGTRKGLGEEAPRVRPQKVFQMYRPLQGGRHQGGGESQRVGKTYSRFNFQGHSQRTGNQQK